MSVNSSFKYSIEDINQNIRKTNAFLRAVNNLRNSVNDIRDVWERPTATKLFWTVIQLSRTYTSLRRIYRLVTAETKAAATLGGLIPPTIFEVGEGGEVGGVELDLSQFNVRVDAFLENLPINIQSIDLSQLPESSSTMIQAILEEDAEITVADAKEILTSRILHPESSTGFLASSIHWEPEVFGTRILADAYYAWWVEQGHDNFTGHWYMQDATERARLRLPEKIRTQIEGLLMDEIK